MAMVVLENVPVTLLAVSAGLAVAGGVLITVIGRRTCPSWMGAEARKCGSWCGKAYKKVEVPEGAQTL